MQQLENILRAGLRLQGYQARDVSTSVGRLHVLEAAGSGTLPPIVLVHGFSSTGIHFIPMLPALRAGARRLILPDLPGHGLSDLLPGGTQLPALERGLVEMLDHVLTEPALFFGSSLGGAVAIRYALARPSRVLGLVLSSPAGAQCAPAELAKVIEQFQIRNHAMALDFVDRLLHEPPGPVRHVLALGAWARFGNAPLQSLLSSLRVEDLITPGQLRRLSMPTVLIWGRRDRILPRSHFDFFRRHLPPGTRIEEPDEVGHAPYLQAPGVLTKSLLRFLRELDAPATSVRSVGTTL